MQNKKDWPTFNIRKVQKKNLKHHDEFILFSPQLDTQKHPQIFSYTNPKKQKQMLIDYSVNEAIISSKSYIDLKNIYNDNKNKNNERKKKLQEEVRSLREQYKEIIQQESRLRIQKEKYDALLNSLRQRIYQSRQKNRMARQLIQSRMNNQAEYLSNLLISLRFQAEYEHDIDPDQMTYEELLQLEEKIGSVSRGLTRQMLENLPCQKLQQNLDDQCTICMSGMEKNEIITILRPCGHKFHRQCVVNWLCKEKVCSLCKRQVQTNKNN